MARHTSGAPLALAAIAAMLFWPRNADASVNPNPQLTPNVGPPDFTPWPPDPALDPANDPPVGELYPIPEIPTGGTVTNLDAFLMMIRRSENYAEDVASGDDYSTFYGRTYFSDMTDHPVITGEKVGIKLPDEWCIAAGFGPGCVSTAAGAYQINVPTWRRIRKASGWGPYLNDFTPASQDAAAVRLIREKGALPLINSGQVEKAVFAMSPIWASLPASKSKQPKHTLSTVLAFYSNALTGMA